MPVNGLRDDIAHELHPRNKAKREQLRNSVWPRVVRVVNDDSRVQQIERAQDGVVCLHWKWAFVSSSAKKSRGAEVEGGGGKKKSVVACASLY